MKHFFRKAAILWSDTLVGPCISCGEEVGCGPVGFRLHETKGFLCDPCLTKCERGLGMMLMAANLLREVATKEPTTGREHDVRYINLLTFATLYERSEVNHWPLRPIGWNEYLKKLDRRMGEAVGTKSLIEFIAAQVN